jgi:hypothetical protein
MKQAYEIKRLEDSTYIIWSVSYVSPTEYLGDIARGLSAQKFRGKVVFDLLLANGNASNRFMGAYFDGETFVHNSFLVIQHDLDRLKRISLSFYHDHLELLEHSVLPKTTQFLIRKNVCV